MDTTTFFAPLGKSELQDDGSLLVYGKITGPDLDNDSQICDPTWLKSAVPDWFAVGNIREMHQPSAVGKAVDLETHGDDYYITAKIVDPGAVAKVQAGVYNGFSIGIKGPKFSVDAVAKNGRITGGRIIETSLADMPVNATSQLVLCKAAGVDLAAGNVSDELVASDAIAPVALDELTAPLEAEVEPAVEVDPQAEPAEKVEVPDTGKAEDEDAEVGIIAQLKTLASAWLAQEAAEVVEGGSVTVVRLITWLLDDIEWAAEIDAMDDIAQAEAAMNARISPIDQEVEVLELNQMADLVKAATADDAPDETKAVLADLVKALGIDEIRTALAEVTAPQEITDLEARLTKVEEMAAPGGPSRIATQADASKSAARDELLADAARYDLQGKNATPRSTLAHDSFAARDELLAKAASL